MLLLIDCLSCIGSTDAPSITMATVMTSGQAAKSSEAVIVVVNPRTIGNT
jgi:hypothetical protein